MDKQNQLHSRPHLQTNTVKPTILHSSPGNFQRVNDASSMQFYHERPMTLNAWTQTTNDDFQFLLVEQHHQQQQQLSIQQIENERKLLEKIRVLEENLRVHSELLSQIHATSAGRSAALQKSAHHSHSPLGTKSIASPNTTSLINQFQQGPKESIKYTIIADGGNNHDNSEPIEIQLAEEDGALNLNSSADSGRLEIFIADENVDIKRETREIKPEDQTSCHSQMEPPQIIQQTQPISATPQYIKRRKIDVESASPTSSPVNNQQLYISKQEVLTPSPQLKPKALLNSTPQPKQKTSPGKLRVARLSPQEQAAARLNNDNVMVSIGPNNTLIPEEVYKSIPWKSASISTRRLLMTIFDRTTLATHSMTGKPSPAFKDQNKPLKKMLDRAKIEDILFAVTMKCGVSEKEVRNAITTKCADENKMMKLQMGKNQTLHVVNKENVA